MISLTTLAMFAAASTLLIFTPGPDIIYVVTRGVAQGRKAALAAAAGFALGSFGHTFFAVVGLSALITSSATAFACVKYAGASYLIYIGFRMLKSHGSAVDGNGPRTPELQCKVIFRQSILANIMNPKVALFFLAFFPQFVKRGEGHVPLQMFILGTTFVLLSMLCFGVIALLSGEISRWLNRSPGSGDKVNRVAGAVLIGLGVRLAWPDRV